jgi:hypothetical protein
MNNSFQTLQSLIENKIIQLDDFYTSSFSKWEVRVQGKYNAKLIEKLTNDYGVEFKVENGFTVGTMAYQDENGDSKLEITFT